MSGTYDDRALQSKKQAVLDGLGRLLGQQAVYRLQKINAMREIAEAALRMASGLERRLDSQD